MNPEGQLTIEGLRTGYSQVEVIHRLSLTVGPGEVVGLAGRNGAGKSSLLRLIYGAERPTAWTQRRSPESRR